MNKLALIAFVLILSGCSNYMSISEGGKFCTPDGNCTFFTVFRDGAVILGDNIVGVVKKECHRGDGDHHILPHKGKHEGKWHCGPSETVITHTKGTIEHIGHVGASVIRFSGNDFDGDDTTINTTNTNAGAKASARSKSSARAKASGKGKAKKKGH